MKCYLDVAQLLGEMLASLQVQNDPDADDYKARAEGAVAALADELSARERLWGAVAKLSTAAAYANGIAEQSSEGSEAVSGDTAERAKGLLTAATNFADIIPLRKAT